MRAIARNLTGQRFGRLLAISPVSPEMISRTKWNCICDCGAHHQTQAWDLCNGATKSCGCLNLDRTATMNRSHGKSNAPEYGNWCSMKDRCYNENKKHYAIYGGRGVTVCERWLKSFQHFLDDMGPKPSPTHTIDRYPNIDGNYEPENCRWADPTEQVMNRRNSVHILFEGNLVSIAEAYRLSKSILTFNTVYSRIRNGWEIHRALTEPRHEGHKHHRKASGKIPKVKSTYSRADMIRDERMLERVR